MKLTTTLTLIWVMLLPGAIAENVAFSVGSNSWGQLGINPSVPVASPIGIVTALAGGGSHTVALKSDGTVWTWGSNNVGELGDGTTFNRSFPVRVKNLNDVIAVAAGYRHSL